MDFKINPKRKIAKNIKRCPKCGSSKIYKRVRAVWVQPRIKLYICRNCKLEFDSPVSDKKNDDTKDNITEDDIAKDIKVGAIW